MTQANELPGHENAPPFQQFTGVVTEVPSKVGHNTLVTPVLRAQIGMNDSIVIAHDAEAPMFGDYLGAPVVAELDLGGTDKFPSQKAVIARVDPQNQGEQLRSLLSIAEQMEGVDSSKPLFVVALADSAVHNFTIVQPSTRYGLFGRFKSNMAWFDVHGVNVDYETDTIVIPNPSVSRQQLIMDYDESGGLRITGQTAKSDTFVTTVATADHKRILEQNETQKEREAAARQAKDKTAGRISRILSRGR